MTGQIHLAWACHSTLTRTHFHLQEMMSNCLAWAHHLILTRMDTPSNSHPDTAEIAADINNSSWAARNSNHPILTPCALLNAAQKAQVKAWKASCKLSAEQQKEAEDTLTTAIQQLLIDENEKISTLAHMT
ncbi:hypothetical protein F4604DRAFT_1694605 [Suillus subluteus]|nr:hypothetical protein F4604DRAFT_1694605 [Suillus subluteus]